MPRNKTYNKSVHSERVPAVTISLLIAAFVKIVVASIIKLLLNVLQALVSDVCVVRKYFIGSQHSHKSELFYPLNSVVINYNVLK